MRIWPSKRAWKRIGIWLSILVAVLLIANGILAWWAEWKLRSRLAAIRAAGDPASIAELAPPPISDDQNAAAIIDRIRPRLKEFSKEYGRFYNTPVGKKYDEVSGRDEPAPKEAIAAIREILNKYADVEQAIHAAAKCDKYGSRMDFSLGHQAYIEKILGVVQDARTATRLLAWRNEVLMSEGGQEAAIQNSLDALRLARLHENEPTLIAYLVAIAMRGIASEQLYDELAMGRVAPDLHKAIDEELAKHEDPKQLAKVLKSERAFAGDWINDHLREYNRVVGHMFGWPIKLMQVGSLNAMNEYMELAERPWYEAKKEFGPNGEPKSAGHGTLAELLVPALRAAFEAHARSLVISRSLRIDNALVAFKEKNGREAKGLEELGLPREATIDPYSGEPLKLKHTPDGWIVYSVMLNGVDDGGDFIELKDNGLAPPRYRMVEKPEPAANEKEAADNQ